VKKCAKILENKHGSSFTSHAVQAEYPLETVAHAVDAVILARKETEEASCPLRFTMLFAVDRISFFDIDRFVTIFISITLIVAVAAWVEI
jgi:hypothetical protein